MMLHGVIGWSRVNCVHLTDLGMCYSAVALLILRSAATLHFLLLFTPANGEKNVTSQSEVETGAAIALKPTIVGVLLATLLALMN